MINKQKLSVLSQNEKYTVAEILKSVASMRPEQKAVFDPTYTIGCVSSGRGWGKSFVAAAWLATKMITVPGARCVVIGRTLTDVKQILIESRDTGIFRYLPYCDTKELPGMKNYHNKSEHRIQLANGSSLIYYGANDCDKLRGSNNLYCVFDEFSSSQGGEALWNDIQMTMRVRREDGIKPQTLAISTPKFNGVTQAIHKMADLFIRGSTYDNADNLSEAFITNLKEQFSGTALEKLELYGEVLDIQNALATPEVIDQHRQDVPDAVDKRVISIDPAVKSGDGNSETGIVVLAKRGEHLYVESDLSAAKPMHELAQVIVDVAHNRDAKILIEDNQGGGFARDILKREARSKGVSVSFNEVTAITGKLERAEVASQELHLGHLHFPLTYRQVPDLESQFCSLSRDPLYFDPKARLDRLDALVHGVRYFKPKGQFRPVG